MLNIPELEKKWFHYKLKQVLPYIFASLIIILLFAYLYFTLNSEEKKHAVAMPKKQEMQLTQIKTNVPEIQKKEILEVNNSKSVQAKVIKLSPSMSFINNFELEEKTILNKEPRTPIKHFAKPKNTITKTKARIKTQEDVASKITIVKQDTQKDIQNILRRFQKDKRPALSLFLAKKYYEIGDYHKAYNYALVTNKMNKEIEGSWLIFAKSLVKLHQKDKAIEILSQYIKNTHSNNAEILLQEIHSGAFK